MNYFTSFSEQFEQSWVVSALLTSAQMKRASYIQNKYRDQLREKYKHWKGFMFT